MDVRCEKCGTEYELEDERVTDKGVTVKCTQCGHLFRVRRRATMSGQPVAGQAVRPVPDLPGGVGKQSGGSAAGGSAGAAKQAAKPKKWLIRKKSGEIFQFRELTTLQQWIVEQKVDRGDEISRTGRTWEKLGAIDELQSFFQVVDQAKAARAAEAAALSAPRQAKSAALKDTQPAEPASGEKKKRPAKLAALKDTQPARAEPEGGSDRQAQASEPGVGDKKAGEAAPGAGAGAQAQAEAEAKTKSAGEAGSKGEGADDEVETVEMKAGGGEVGRQVGPEEAGETAEREEAEEDLDEEEMETTEMEPARSGAYKMGEPVVEEARKGPSELGEAGSKAGRTAAWEKEGFRVSPKAAEPTSEVFTEEAAIKRPGAGFLKVIVVIVIAGLVGGGVYVGVSKWERILDLISGERDKTLDRYGHARALLLQDTDQSLDKALELFREVYGAKKSARARAGQAEVLALQALYKRWEAAHLTSEADRIEKAAGEVGSDPVPQKTSGAAGGASGSGAAGRKSGAAQPGGDVKAGLASAMPPPAEVSRLRQKAAEIRGQAGVLAKQALSYAKDAFALESNALTHRVMAEALLAAGREDASVSEHLDRALEARGNDPEALFAKAAFEYRNDKPEEARQTLKQAIAIQRKQSTKLLYRAHFLLAHVLVALDRSTKARSELQTILATNKQHTRSQKLLDRLAEKERRAETRVARAEPGADAGAEKASAPDGGVGAAGGRAADGEEQEGDYDTLVRRGDRYSENGRVSEAMRAYKKALDKQPGGVEALTGLAYCYLDRGRTGKAVSTFRKALSYSSSYGEALIGMAEVYKRRSSWKKALEYYKKYVQHHPGGRKRGLAQRNIRELEDRVKPREPEAPAGAVDAGASGNASGGASEEGTTKVVVPPPGMSARPEARPSSEAGGEAGSGAGGEKPGEAAPPRGGAQGGGSEAGSGMEVAPPPARPSDSSDEKSAARPSPEPAAPARPEPRPR
jgi:predicted Zn finger-like uncharacterized protein